MTTQTEETTRTTSLEQQIGKLEGGYEQLGMRVEDQVVATNKLRDETNANFAEQRKEMNANFAAQTAARENLRDEMNANFAAQTAATDKLRDEMNAQGESIRADLTAKIDAQGESIRAEMHAQFAQVNSRLNAMMVVGATVAVALFTAMVGGFIAIFLRL